MLPQRVYGIPPGYRVGQNDSSQIPDFGIARAPVSRQSVLDQASMRHYGSPPNFSTSPAGRTIHHHERSNSPLKRTADRSRSRINDSSSRVGQSQSLRPQDWAPPDRRTQRYSDSSLDSDDFVHATLRGGLSGSPTGHQGNQPFNSGSRALRDIDNLFGAGRVSVSSSPEPEEQDIYSRPYGPQTAYGTAPPPAYSYRSMPDTLAAASRRSGHRPHDSQSSTAPLQPRTAQRDSAPPSPSRQERPAVQMVYNAYPANDYDDCVNHDDFDDEDDVVPRQTEQRRKRDRKVAAPITAAIGSSAAGMFRAFGSRDTSGSYYSMRGGSPSRADRNPEKSEWLQKNSNGNKRMKWIIGSIIVVVLLAAIIGGVLGGILANRKSSGAGSSTSNSISSKDGLYDINSPQVKKLLNNSALHKVFPGMDYTPLNAQYPDCLTDPPDQNNITLDITMLAQLTPAVRLYGTDCNQTEMVLESINRLGYNDTIKVWLGVWLGDNSTTNARQLKQMYEILDTYPSTQFAGIIVGNEVLFRKDLSEKELGQQLTYVRNNLTAKQIDLPVATSDLGDDWTASLAADTDIVMANVHPFFAGVTPDVAPGWTWDFWQTNDVALTGIGKSTAGYPKNIIAETGWPSEGGNDCGTDSGTCPNSTAGAVASVDNMNTFLDGWVCESLKNGTTYFWFEAFDEPWKVIFDTDTDKWESKWGLMDSNRNVKTGLKIPDCGGQTVDKPY